MKLLRDLLSRYPWQTLGLAVATGLAAAWLGHFATYSPEVPATMSRAAVRRVSAGIHQALGTVATDTPRATAALAAGRRHLDTAADHARRAISYHQQTPPHAKRPHPAATAADTAAAALELRRQLTGF